MHWFRVCLLLACFVATAWVTTGCKKEGGDGTPEPVPRQVSGDPEADDDGDGLTNGLEATLGTDPGKVDSDGDGYADGVEVNELNFDPSVNPYKFNPLIADVPKLELEVVGMPTVYITHTEANGEATTIDNSTAATQSGSVTSSRTMSESIRTEVSSTVGASSTASVGTDTSASSTVNASVTGSLAAEQSSSWTDTQTHENSETLTQSRGFSSSRDVVKSGGEVHVTVNIYNRGYLPFTLQTVSLNVQKTVPGHGQPLNLGHLEPKSGNSYFSRGTLAGGKGIEGMIFEAKDLNLTIAEQLLAPGAFMIKTSQYELKDSEDRSYNHRFLAIDALTTQIVIDYGMDQTSESYLVSTVSDPTGRSLRSVLEDALYMPYEAGDTLWKYADSVGRTKPGLLRLREVATDSERGGYWVVSIRQFDGLKESVRDYNPLRESLDLDAVKVKPGMTVNFTYVVDADRDGLGARTEFILGTDPQTVDTDGDGMGDGDEVREGRDPLYDDRNQRPAVTQPVLTSMDRTATLRLALTDPENDPAHSLVVDWGDGSRTTLAEPHNGPLRLQHSYARHGSYEVTATPYATPRHAGESLSRRVTTGAAYALGWSIPPPVPGWGLSHLDVDRETGAIYIAGLVPEDQQIDGKSSKFALTRLDQTGKVQWTRSIQGLSRTADLQGLVARAGGGAMVVFDDLVKSRESGLVCFSEDGTQDWARPISGMGVRDINVVTSDAAGNIYLGLGCTRPPKMLTSVPKSDNWLYCLIKLNADGSPAWSVRVEEKPGSQDFMVKAISVDADGTILVASKDVKEIRTRGGVLVTAYSPAGKPLWAATTGRDKTSSPYGITRLADGRIVVGMSMHRMTNNTVTGFGSAHTGFTPAGKELWAKEAWFTDAMIGYGAFGRGPGDVLLSLGSRWAKGDGKAPKISPYVSAWNDDMDAIGEIALPVPSNLLPVQFVALPNGDLLCIGSADKSLQPTRYRLEKPAVVFTLFKAK